VAWSFSPASSWQPDCEPEGSCVQHVSSCAQEPVGLPPPELLVVPPELLVVPPELLVVPPELLLVALHCEEQLALRHVLTPWLADGQLPSWLLLSQLAALPPEPQTHETKSLQALSKVLS
jgi:hypothetical protein